jgi:hypothetical protein
MTNDRKEQIARETGIAPDDLATIGEDRVLAMMERGVLVQLHIRYWRPYAQLRLADLGLEDVNGVTSNYIQLGRKKLLPPDLISKIETVERRARTALKNNSLKCFWGSFIPTTAWEKWRELSDKLQKRFYEVRDEIVRALPESKETLREIYSEMATDAYRRSKLDADVEVPQDFINTFVAACLNRIPSAEQIGAAFRYDEVYNYIPLPSQVRAHAEGLIQDDMRRQIASQMHTEKQQMMDGFIAEVSSGLRNMVVKVAQSVKDSIEKNDGKLIPRSTSDIKRLLEKLGRLNFYDDKSIRGMVTDIRAEVDKPLKERDVPSIQRVLDDVLKVSQEQISEIASRTPSRFDEIELDGGENE